MIDHRASPGVTAEDLKKVGLAGPVVGEGKLLELKTYTCAHCQGVVIMNPERVRERYSCHKCHARICDGCAAIGECRPFEATVEEQLNMVLCGGK